MPFTIAPKNTSIGNDHVHIIDYHPQYAEAFKEINLNWIKQYFKVEEADNKTLSNPQSSIIDKGGKILFAQDTTTGKIIGTCALLPHPDMFELSKMGVLPEARGKDVGNLLMQGVLLKAKQMGLTSLFLETNSSLAAAIHLYEKYGFKHVPLDPQSPYARADVRMLLVLPSI